MSEPVWLSWPLAGLMVVAALIHSGRLVAAHQRAASRGYAAATSGFDVDLTTY